jgi:2-polyprenyl-6-methoxyphenol hydroxylase-like FAD-dependent oxidoreductase
MRSMKHESKVVEQEREIPVLDRVEVLVAGGGPAGLAAAIAAARQGAQVGLLERYGYVGGMATGGLVLMLDRMGNDEGQQVVRGIAQELIERLDAMGAVTYPPQEVWGSRDTEAVNVWRYIGAVGPQSRRVRYSPTVDPEYLKILGARMLEEASVRCLFHCWVCSAVVADGAVQGVIFESKSGRLAVLAQVVVDCTGDGDVFASAAADFERQDLPLALVFRLGGVDIEKANTFVNANPEEFDVLVKELREAGGTGGGVGGLNAIYYRTVRDGIVWCNNSVRTADALDVVELTKAEKERRETALITLEFFRKHLPGFEEAFLVDTAPQLGTRGSRRIVGEHTLTRDEWMGEQRFDDVVAMCSPRTEGEPLISIPYGCLVPRELEGLLAAGRCISVDAMVHNCSRLIPPCLATGQAAGTAAAMAVARGVEPRGIDRAQLQALLAQQDVRLS